MRAGLSAALCVVVAAAATAVAATATAAAAAGPCPCANATLCEAVRAAPRKEVFVFSTKDYESYPWGHFTTLATYHDVEAEVLCRAHANGVRVVRAVGGPETLTDPAVRKAWVSAQVSMVQSQFLDGINLDLERVMAQGSAEAAGLTALLTDVAVALHAAVPGSQVSFDGAMRPGYEGRWYDYGALSAEIDFVFVMAYDLNDYNDPPEWNDHSMANSPLPVIKEGVSELVAAGVPREKLVLGLPWYGYGYLCEFWDRTPVAPPGDPVPPCNVSDALYTQLDYDSIVNQWAPYADGPAVADNSSVSRVLSFGGHPVWGQIWFDDPSTILAKSRFAASAGLRGVGMWEADKLNYTLRAQADAMWGALVAPWYPLS